MLQQQSHDALNRRHRHKPHSTGKRISLQPRDLLWFQKLAGHGPLSSSFLHAFSKGLAKNEKRARDRLTDLFNEQESLHGGAYLTRPWQQFETFDARYQDLVYDLGKPAIAALKEQGMWREPLRSHSGAWKHNCMVAAVTASIELATRSDPSLNFIPQYEIQARAGAELRYPVPMTIPRSKRSRDIDLIPDALFGLEYRQGGKNTYRFFVVEADRGTEPSKASKFNRKSHWRNFLQYREYIGGGFYKQHLALTAGLLVLNITKDDATMLRMVKLGEELFERGNTYMLFQTAEGFGRYFKPPKPSDQFLRAPWQRIGFEPFRIDQP